MKEDLTKEYYVQYSLGNWQNAERILKEYYQDKTKTFWFYTTCSALKYEQREYESALNFSEKAYNLNPESPLVLWDYAGVLFMLDRESEAISYWKSIIEQGEHKIGNILTSEGIKWARSLINDCKFRIGQALYYLEKDVESMQYLKEHLKSRKRGLKSLYSKKEVEEYLSKLEEA